MLNSCYHGLSTEEITTGDVGKKRVFGGLFSKSKFCARILLSENFRAKSQRRMVVDYSDAGSLVVLLCDVGVYVKKHGC